MAACVSEYTLEVFTLLNAKGKKELIEWCMKEGLIASNYECPKCNKQIRLYERESDVLDGFEWRCRMGMFDHYLAECIWQDSHGKGSFKICCYAVPSTRKRSAFHTVASEQKKQKFRPANIPYRFSPSANRRIFLKKKEERKDVLLELPSKEVCSSE
ncbi:uncharacterized protein TNCV_1611641 [Trichonephila clavipes]|nr:uncharacterized protein TNCV_1611641 [Trichonephila clavipes]